MAVGDHPAAETGAPPSPRFWRTRRLLRWLGIALTGLLVLFALVIAWLHTGWGRQWIAERIAAYAPASGLSVEVGRIEGSVLWSATLFDVKLRDAEGTLFLEVPEVDLNWRPLKFFVEISPTISFFRETRTNTEVSIVRLNPSHIAFNGP